MARFSERIGKVSPRSAIQIEAMDVPLRNAIWNAVDVLVFGGLSGWINDEWQWRLCQAIWIEFFRLPVDEIDAYWSRTKQKIRVWFFSAQWYEVYDFVEFLGEFYTAQLPDPWVDRFMFAITAALEREMSGYRFVAGELAPMTNEQEIAAIESALANTSQLAAVESHLQSALSKLSHRTNPDFRNSIKESISAVEALCRVITGDDRATLGQALKRLTDRGLKFHPALEKAWGSLYGYTNDEDGIRHAMLDESTLTLADAKYFLVSCSAFITYLIELARNAGLPLK